MTELFHKAKIRQASSRVFYVYTLNVALTNNDTMYNTHSYIRDELADWCSQNCSKTYSFRGSKLTRIRVSFGSTHDACLFKLVTAKND